MRERPIAIVGGGQFGLRALQWAQKHQRPAVVFDSDPNAQVGAHVNRLFGPEEEWVPEDLVDTPSVLILRDATECIPLIEQLQPEFVIPTIPVHFFAIALLYAAQQEGAEYDPDRDEIAAIAAKLPFDLDIIVNAEDGILTLSYAQEAELCPPNCTGPILYCPIFCRAKPFTITQIITDIAQNMPDCFFAESQQLTAGLGGITGIVYFGALEKIRSYQPPKILVATTCNCHGVVQAFERQKK
ncbi:MAG TPA: hypothetical protein VKK79_05825 [Candidatus Lokiarchaeia archaeon]|nr:hypothetical protein [Candidatus Lokiarchaeia archaeon]